LVIRDPTFCTLLNHITGPLQHFN